MFWLRSALALIVGAVVVVVGSEGTDWLLRAQHLFPPVEARLDAAQYWIAIVHRCMWGVAGSAVAAFLAPSRPMLHALILGGIGFAANLAGLIAMWSFGDHWYPAVLTITALPCGWLGGVLAGGRRRAA